MKMVLAWGRYAVLCIFLLSLYFLYGNQIFLVFFGLMLVFLPVSYFVCKKIFETLSVSIRSKRVFGTTGDKILIEILVSNPKPFPLLDTQIEYGTASGFYPNRELFSVECPVSAGGETTVFSKEMEYVRCGCYHFSLKKIRVYDYLHLFSLSKDCDEHAEVMIYPRKMIIDSEELYAQKEGFDEYDNAKGRGNISGDVTDLREYVPGDRLQRIHWKLSSKLGKWMVKENEATSSNRYVILPELGPAEELEKSMSYFYSLAGECVKRRIEFDVLVYQKKGTDFLTITVRSEEELSSMMMTLFCQEIYEASYEAYEVLERSGIYHGELVHVTKDGALLQEIDKG